MTSALRKRELAVLVAALVTGLAGAVVGLGARNGDAQFLHDQLQPPNLRAVDVERVVQTAPDPRTGSGEGDAATCKRGADTPLGNPWSCVIRYPSGRRARLGVRVLADGSYEGRFRDVAGAGASGCCIDLPGTR